MKLATLLGEENKFLKNFESLCKVNEQLLQDLKSIYKKVVNPKLNYDYIVNPFYLN